LIFTQGEKKKKKRKIFTFHPGRGDGKPWSSQKTHLILLNLEGKGGGRKKRRGFSFPYFRPAVGKKGGWKRKRKFDHIHLIIEGGREGGKKEVTLSLYQRRWRQKRGERGEVN